jgi:hypothetical protein
MCRLRTGLHTACTATTAKVVAARTCTCNNQPVQISLTRRHHKLTVAPERVNPVCRTRIFILRDDPTKRREAITGTTRLNDAQQGWSYH